MIKKVLKLSSIILILVVLSSGCGKNEELEAANVTLTEQIKEVENLESSLTEAQTDLKKEQEINDKLQIEFDNYKEKMSPYEELAEVELEAAKEKAEAEKVKAKAEAEEAKAKAEVEKAKVEEEKRVKEESEKKKEAEAIAKKEAEEVEKAKQQEEAENGTIGDRNALSKAKQYLKFTAFSAEGLVEQLEFEGFSSSEADFGVKHSGADWNEQAALKSEQYLSYSSFSKQGLIDQLIFEGFTQEQAKYGASKVGY